MEEDGGGVDACEMDGTRWMELLKSRKFYDFGVFVLRPFCSFFLPCVDIFRLRSQGNHNIKLHLI